MEGKGLESLLVRESIRKLYSQTRTDYDMEANVPHWVRTLVHLFKGLSVEVKTIHSNKSNGGSIYNGISSKQQRIELDPNTCCIHDELMKNVQKEKEQFEERISSLKVVIEENKTHLRRNCLLVNRIKEMGFDGTSNELYSTVERLHQFEAKCRSYEQLCEKVVKEKIRLEQKVELLEEVIDEFSKFTRCNCSRNSGAAVCKNKNISTDDEISISDGTSTSTMLAAR